MDTGQISTAAAMSSHQSGINHQQNNVHINVLATLLAVSGVCSKGRHHDNELLIFGF